MKSHRKPTECSGRHRKAIAGHRGSPESVAELRKAPEQYRSASEAYAEHRKAIAGHRGSPERLRKASEGFGRRREASEGFGKAPEGVGGLRETSEGFGRRRGAPERRRRATRSIGSCAEDLSYSRKSRRRRGDISDKTKSAFRCTDNLRERARHLRRLTAGQTLRLAKSCVSFGRTGLANRFMGEPAFGESRAFASLRR